MVTNNSINTKKTVLQIVESNTNSLSTTAAIILFNDSKPQNTEGTEYLTATITPIYSTSTLEIVVQEGGRMLSNSEEGTLALFQDATADALACTFIGKEWSGIGKTSNFYLKHVMTAGTTSPTTFKVRIGVSGSSFQQFSTYGGTQINRIRIIEYGP